jgi:hypothetical protein
MSAQRTGSFDRGLTGKFVLGLSVAVAVGLVAFALVARAARPGVEQPHLASMQESASALAAGGSTMVAHGQAMLAEGQRTGDQDLVAHGEHWVRDGQALSQRARWLAMDPLAPSGLVTSPAELSQQGSWGELTQTAAAMLHDPSRARAVDLEALRWNGLAMQAEGRMMAEHGQLMVEEAELMVARHGLAGQVAADLRQAAQAMREVGAHLQGNGQAMIDYADRLRRSMGYR